MMFEMAIGLVGKKSGMTRVFTEEGDSVPVTVIEVEPNRITQVKTLETDGYDAVQVTTGAVKQNRVSRPKAGHFAKANTPATTLIAMASSLTQPNGKSWRSTGCLLTKTAPMSRAS